MSGAGGATNTVLPPLTDLGSRLMSIVSDSTVPADPAHAHPSWCWPGTCTAPDRLEERGEQEHDVPMYRRSSHFSTAHVIPVTRVSEVEIRLELFRDVYTEVTDEPEGVLLSYFAEYCGHSGTLILAVEQLGPLARAFAEVRDVVRSGNPPTLVELAIRALADFYVTDAGTAARLLPMWRRYAELSPADVESVIAWFVDSNDELRPTGGDQ